jgi:ParB-like chromosome segregation protein Spo0J
MKIDFKEIRKDVDGMSNCRAAALGIEELADSIKTQGMFSNIGVWKPPGKNYFVLNYGYRRYAALAWLRDNDPEAFKPFQVLEVSVFEGSLNSALLRNIQENIDRKNLNNAELLDRVYFLYTKDKDAQGKGGLSTNDIANALGRKQPQIVTMIGTRMKLIPEAMEALRHGLIKMDHANKLAVFGPEDQASYLEGLLDPAQQKAFKKLLEKKAKGGIKPSVKTLQEKIKQVESCAADTDRDYRAGVALGLRYAIGLAPVEYLLAPAQAIPREDAATAKQVPFLGKE